MTDYGPTIPLMRFFERETRHGKSYLVGRLGLAKVVIFKTGDVSDTGTPIWNAFVQEAPQKAVQPSADASEATAHRNARRPRPPRRLPADQQLEQNPEPSRTGTFDDPIPF